MTVEALSPIVPLGLLAWALLLVGLPRTRNGLLLLALAGLAQVVFYAPRIHMHDTYAYLLFDQAEGRLGPDWMYGEGRVALLTWPLRAMGNPVDGTHWVHATLTALAVPHLYAAMREAFDETTGVLAAILFALAPLPLAMAPTETAYVPLATMEVLAVHGLLRGGRLGDAMAIVGAGMVPHLRPLEGLVGAGFVAAAWAMGRRRAALGVAALVAWRLAIFYGHSWGRHYTAWNFLPAFDHAIAGTDGRALVLDPHRTPVALTALALLGTVLAARRSPRVAAGLVALGALSTVAHLNFPYLADRMRYELPSQLWLCALAGVGMAALWPRRVVASATLVALGVSWWVARQPYPPFPWQAEYTALREALPKVPRGEAIAYDASMDSQGHVRAWAERYAGVHLISATDTQHIARWRWVGLTDHRHGVLPPRPRPVWEVTLPPLSPSVDPLNHEQWHCDPCQDVPMTLGLYELGSAGR